MPDLVVEPILGKPGAKFAADGHRTVFPTCTSNPNRQPGLSLTAVRRQ